ncbi:MAG TPA: hypothetical protein VKK79_25080, partial [Candidatus Lokiarchaeia archaeon]|nr:hypothetical protein [Candidatus Lokiarchaeia archaeon]
MSDNPGENNPDVLQDSAQLQALIEKEIENNKRQRAYNLYKTSLGDHLSADEREILLWRARRVLLATTDEVPDAVSLTGTNEDVQLAGAWDFERLDYFLVPLSAFGPRAFSTLTLAQLYERARDTWQAAEVGFGAFVLAPAPANADAAQLVQLEKLLDDIKGFHYGLIAAGLHLYVIVERLRNQYGNLVLLQVQSQLAALILQYCAHDPQSAFPLEEAGLHSLEAIPSLVAQVQDFLNSPGAVLLAPGTPAPAAPQPVASPNPAPATVRAVFGRFARDFGDLPRVKYVPGTGKKAQVAAVFAVKAGEVTVDLSPGRPPADILTDLLALVAGFLQDESYTIDSLRSAAASLQYNLQTNEWGSVAAGTEYVAQLESIRKNILRYMKIDDTAGATIPRIFYKQYYRVIYLRGGLVPGEVYHSDTLMPGESVQKRMSAKQFTKQSQSENRSFTQAVDDTTRSQIDAKMENETTNRQEDTTNLNTYQNTQDHFEVGLKAGYNANIPKVGGKGSTGRGSQGGGQGVNVAFNIGYSKDTQKGTSKDVNSTREAQQRVLNSVNNSLMNEHKATASQTVGSSAESTVEETTEQSTTRTFANPNTASTLRLDLVGLL